MYVAAAITDTHLTRSNSDQVESIMSQFWGFCVEHKIEHAFHFGDWFTSRPGQHQRALLTTKRILQSKPVDIQFHIIPGNHDKTDQLASGSYLDVFDGQGMTVYPSSGRVEIIKDKLHMFLLPYYKEGSAILKEQFEELEEAAKAAKGIVMLGTHLAINGVRNNDGSVVDYGITTKAFNAFDVTLVGHYHNRSELPNNIHYIGSSYPQNYGEDNEKGFIGIKKNGHFDFIRPHFAEYHKIKVHLDDFNQDASSTLKLLDRLRSPDDGATLNNVRVVLVGARESLRGVNRDIFEDIGIDCKLKPLEIEEAVESVSVEDFRSFTVSSLLEEFETFCKEREYDLDEGLFFLKKLEDEQV